MKRTRETFEWQKNDLFLSGDESINQIDKKQLKLAFYLISYSNIFNLNSDANFRIVLYIFTSDLIWANCPLFPQKRKKKFQFIGLIHYCYQMINQQQMRIRNLH